MIYHLRSRQLFFLCFLFVFFSIALSLQNFNEDEQPPQSASFEAPDEMIEYETELVEERLDVEADALDELFVTNEETGEIDEQRESILNEVDEIYAKFEDLKGMLFSNYSTRVRPISKALDLFIDEGKLAFEYAKQNDVRFDDRTSFEISSTLPDEQENQVEFAQLHVSAEALFILAAMFETGTLHVQMLSDSQRNMFYEEGPGGPDNLWTLRALKASNFAGNEAAAAALADRALVGRGGVMANCQKSVELLEPLAVKRELEIQKAGASSISGLPAQATWLRDRERDASWHANMKEESLAEEHQKNFIGSSDDSSEFTPNSGTAESTRIEGYRRLMGTDGRERDEIGALERFENAAARGDQLAAFNAGFMYMRGHTGVPVNLTAAELYFKKAGDANGAGAYNGIGVIYYNKRDFVTARHWFEKAIAAKNNPDAYYNLGTLYIHGLGDLTKNATEGFLNYEKASKNGHWRAPFELAKMHLNGVGTPLNCTRAARLFRIFYGERTGWADELEITLHTLDGVDENRKKIKNIHPFGALISYSLFAEQGSEVAIQNVAFMLRKNLTGDIEIPNRFEIAGNLLRRVTRSPGVSPEANIDLGYMLWKKQIQVNRADFALSDDEERSLISDDEMSSMMFKTFSNEKNDPSSSEFSENYRAAITRYRRATEGELPIPEAFVSLAWAHFTEKGGLTKNNTAVLEYINKALDSARFEAEMFPTLLFYGYVKFVEFFGSRAYLFISNKYIPSLFIALVIERIITNRRRNRR